MTRTAKYLRALVAWLISLAPMPARKRLARRVLRVIDALALFGLALRGQQVIAGAEDDPDPDPGPDPKDPDPKDPADPDPKDPDPDPDPKDDEWKVQSRKHERRAKTEKQRADELQAKLDKIAAENLSDNEKALKAARDEATSEVTAKYETERRQDRLELATTRLATKGVKLTLDGEEKTVKFADPDDALAHLERAIKRGDVDGDDIFGEDGKVDRDALTAALAELLEDKPHLRAGNGGNGNGSGDGNGRRGAGDADTGKGKGGGKSIEEMSPDDHLKAIQKK